MQTKKMVTIYTEANPNPDSLKFVANFMLVQEGISRDYPDLESTKEAPLAQALFSQFDFIERVFYMSNFITVTKKGEVEWFEIKAGIQQFIKNYLEEDKPVLTEKISEVHEQPQSGNNVATKINGILEEYIRPAVEMDGGAITLSSYDDGVVTVKLQGSCNGCPSSMITLKAGIENLLKKMVPEVKNVVAENA